MELFVAPTPRNLDEQSCRLFVARPDPKNSLTSSEAKTREPPEQRLAVGVSLE